MEYVKVTTKSGAKIHVLPHEADVLVKSNLASYGHDGKAIENAPENKAVDPKRKRAKKEDANN